MPSAPVLSVIRKRSLRDGLEQLSSLGSLPGHGASGCWEPYLTQVQSTARYVHLDLDSIQAAAAWIIRCF